VQHLEAPESGWWHWARSAPPGVLLRDLQARLVAPRRGAQLAAAREQLAATADLDRRKDLVDQMVPGGSSQDPAEFVPFLRHVQASKPRVVVEIGVEAGATHVLLAQACESIETTIAVDLFVYNEPRIRRLVPEGVRTHVILGDSRDPLTVRRVDDALGGRPIDLLFIDGDHSFTGALGDFRTYASRTRPGGLIAFHDIVADGAIRTGSATGAYAGEVPWLWHVLKRQYRAHEYIADPNQEGRGIGVIVWDPDVRLEMDPARLLT
jgi:predicted O-methyltransferase YrrM